MTFPLLDSYNELNFIKRFDERNDLIIIIDIIIDPIEKLNVFLALNK